MTVGELHETYKKTGFLSQILPQIKKKEIKKWVEMMTGPVLLFQISLLSDM